MNRKFLYKPINQLKYHCVPACIVMILDRRKIKYGTQEEIGYELGLIVPKDEVCNFKKVRTSKKPIAGYGTQAIKKQYSINHFFKKYKVNLKEKYFPINKIKNIEKFIVDNLRDGNDLIACFNYRALYRPKDKKRNGQGHVSLIQSINGNIVILIDPENDVQKKRRIELLNLIDAMKYHGEKARGGFWVIS